ncbi:hypothetical protein ACFL2Q_06990 [Thermodesulfobacteriota bacterium]
MAIKWEAAHCAFDYRAFGCQAFGYQAVHSALGGALAYWDAHYAFGYQAVHSALGGALAYWDAHYAFGYQVFGCPAAHCA